MSEPTKRKSGCLFAFFIVVLVLSVAINLVFLATEFSIDGLGGEKKFTETEIHKPAAGVKTKIAVIKLEGLISTGVAGGVGDTMVDDLKLQLTQALEDDKVKAIVVAIDSPGGEVNASDMIYEALKKAREKKKIVISMGVVAASGGYYSAMGGTYVMALDGTYTGSIGVIMSLPNFTDLLGKVGVEWITLKSGALKDVPSMTRKMTPPEREYLQRTIMQSYDKFVGIVATERKLDLEGLKNGNADGRVLSGRDAVAAKLVDEIGDLDAAILKAAELGQAVGSGSVKYESKAGIARYLKLLGKADTESSKKIELNLGGVNAALQLKPGVQYYVPAMLAP
jgi:protease-4